MPKGSILGMEKRWKLNSDNNFGESIKLAGQLGVPKIIGQLLISRGINSFEEAKKFFRPNLSDLHDPFLMDDMHLAVQRVIEAIENDEKIMIFGDYDVDGTTAVTLVYEHLSLFTGRVTHYQPDRYTEGYGVSFQAIEIAKQNQISLIIALDCGIKANDKIEKANEYGIDFIVCDHHRPGEDLPKAYAILNPKKEHCTYPYEELCGAGIGYKLMTALSKQTGRHIEQLDNLLDLVAIATAADIVPITGENRTLVHFGLKQLEKNKRIGIATMLELATKSPPLTVSDLVFIIAPRINAAGRMASASSAVELLLSTNNKTAIEKARQINQLNKDRKETDASITSEALEILSTECDSRSTNVVWDSSWHKGVVGIVASRIIETYYKPTIVLTITDGIATGSARSVTGFDVYNAIEACQDLLLKFGGHKYAAGLTLKAENLETFKIRFEAAVSQTIDPELLIPEVKIDAEIFSSDLIPDKSNTPFPKLFRIIEQFEPFGPGNYRPTFKISNLRDTANSRVVGASHLKLSATSLDTNINLNGIGFGLGNKLNIVQNAKYFDVVCSLDKNYYQEKYSLQLIVKDLRSTDKDS